MTVHYSDAPKVASTPTLFPHHPSKTLSFCCSQLSALMSIYRLTSTELHGTTHRFYSKTLENTNWFLNTDSIFFLQKLLKFLIRNFIIIYAYFCRHQTICQFKVSSLTFEFYNGLIPSIAPLLWQHWIGHFAREFQNLIQAIKEEKINKKSNGKSVGLI